MSDIKKISECRICGNRNLVRVVDLGEQYLTGVFPKSINKESLTRGPLRLVKCFGEDACGLLQLEHSYDLDEMYGDNYGYRSGLNKDMVEHLRNKVKKIRSLVDIEEDDLVIDIGSNDGTTLGFYPDNVDLVGVDPTSEKFRGFYKPHIELITDFFSANLIGDKFNGRKAKVITSFSMLYDLESPQKFFDDVASILDPKEGVWVTEQSYMPLMLEKVTFDTICHEHLEYYAIKQLEWMAKKSGLILLDAETNLVNGGSVSVVFGMEGCRHKVNKKNVNDLMTLEMDMCLDDIRPYELFSKDIDDARSALVNFVDNAKSEGKRVCGLGASTKGNVLLQYCGFTSDDIEVIAEINPDKFGSYAPGSWIPIADEMDVLNSKPDYLVVLPWHFKDFFLSNKRYKGHNLVFPLPTLELVRVQ